MMDQKMDKFLKSCDDLILEEDRMTAELTDKIIVIEGTDEILINEWDLGVFEDDGEL